MKENSLSLFLSPYNFGNFVTLGSLTPLLHDAYESD